MTGMFGNAVVQQVRLDLVEQLLLASGWDKTPAGWMAPEYIREMRAQEVGHGHVSLLVAISAQVQFDEACVERALHKWESAAGVCNGRQAQGAVAA